MVYNYPFNIFLKKKIKKKIVKLNLEFFPKRPFSSSLLCTRAKYFSFKNYVKDYLKWFPFVALHDLVRAHLQLELLLLHALLVLFETRGDQSLASRAVISRLSRAAGVL